MRTPNHWRIFLGFNICLAFWHIFRHNLILSAHKKTQQLIAQNHILQARKQELSKIVCALRSPQAINAFAHQQSMHTIRLDQIHTVPYDQNAS